MRSRSVDERHRAATPLELLFDLTFVVAVAAAASELAHAIRDNHPAEGAIGYLVAFFAIWWAWMNFTWFASAYDVDDVPYRLLTLLQMVGVLILAAGVPTFFSRGDFTTATVGYVVMRVAMLIQWARAARSDPDHRPTASAYIAGIAAVQVAWVLRLFLPPAIALPAVPVLFAAEMALPWWAERRGTTTWNPHHIAERYGLFTLIVLGECVLAAARALAPATESGVSAGVLLVAAGGLLMLFALWWFYFLEPAADGLARRRELVLWWAYGHYGVFAGIAAIGAGLEVAAETLDHAIAAPPLLVALSIAVPLCLVVVLVWALHAPLGGAPWRTAPSIVAFVLATLVAAGATAAGLPLPWAVLLMGLPVTALVAAGVLAGYSRPRPVPSAGEGDERRKLAPETGVHQPGGVDDHGHRAEVVHQGPRHRTDDAGGRQE